MNPHTKRLWELNDATPLPLSDRIANQYARGQCEELIEWTNNRYVVVVDSDSDGTQVEESILSFQQRVFGRHLRLLYSYKQSADANSVTHCRNFNSQSLKIQLTALYDKYCANEVQKLTDQGLLPIEQHSNATALFDFPGAITVKQKQPDDSSAISYTKYCSKVKELVTLGRTNRDALHEAFLAGVKLEKTGM